MALLSAVLTKACTSLPLRLFCASVTLRSLNFFPYHSGRFPPSPSSLCLFCFWFTSFRVLLLDLLFTVTLWLLSHNHLGLNFGRSLCRSRHHAITGDSRSDHSVSSPTASAPDVSLRHGTLRHEVAADDGLGFVNATFSVRLPPTTGCATPAPTRWERFGKFGALGGDNPFFINIGLGSFRKSARTQSGLSAHSLWAPPRTQSPLRCFGALSRGPALHLAPRRPHGRLSSPRHSASSLCSCVEFQRCHNDLHLHLRLKLEHHHRPLHWFLDRWLCHMPEHFLSHSMWCVTRPIDD